LALQKEKQMIADAALDGAKKSNFKQSFVNQ